MKNHLKDYKNIIFFGGGIMAERIYNQSEDIRKKLAGVFDLLKNRQVTTFHGFMIRHADEILSQLEDNDNAIVVAIGHFGVFKIVNQLLSSHRYIEDRLFVVNPYQSLRFFCVDDELSADKKIPFSDKRYTQLRSLLSDDSSIKLYDRLVSSKPYENIHDDYEIIPYLDIKDMYYYTEDYWDTYQFPASGETGATVLDCGAYIGDSVMPICNAIPEEDIYYYAIEPLEENIAAMTKEPKFRSICKEFHILDCGVGTKDEKLYFHLPANGDPEGGRSNRCIGYSGNQKNRQLGYRL